MIEIDEQALNDYRSLAANSPGWYRCRVLFMAIAGDATLTVAQILPIVLPMMLGVLLFPHPWLIGMSVFGTLFLIWVTRPQLRTTGRRLQRAEAPALFEAIDSMADRLQVPRGIEVWVDDRFNASAGEGRGLFGLLGTRRVMTIGMPFLACMTKPDLLAVVAHELGHFSHRHGRLSNWLYRARMGWEDYAQRNEQHTTAFDRAASWYARSFAPRFLTLSLLHSRSCEYEADRAAAELVGKQCLAAALTRVVLVSDMGWAAMQEAIGRWQKESFEPPGNFHAQLHGEIERLLGRRGNDWIAEVMSVPSGWRDTHPSLAERLGSLGAQPVLEGAVTTAGEALLGQSWPRMAGEFDATWQREQAPAWRIRHIAFRTLWTPLLARRAEGQSLDSMARLRLARALRAFDHQAATEELEALYGEHETAPEVCFELGAARLRENRADGVELLESAAERDASYAEAAYSRLRDYAERVADNTGMRRWESRWQQAAAALSAAAERALESVRSGNAEPGGFGADVLDFLREIVRSDACVQQMWAASAVVAITDGRKATGSAIIHVVVVRLVTATLHAASEDEEKVCERYQNALAAVLPRNDVVLVVSCLTTEEVPAFVGNCVSVTSRNAIEIEAAPATPS